MFVPPPAPRLSQAQVRARLKEAAKKRLQQHEESETSSVVSVVDTTAAATALSEATGKEYFAAPTTTVSSFDDVSVRSGPSVSGFSGESGRSRFFGNEEKEKRREKERERKRQEKIRQEERKRGFEDSNEKQPRMRSFWRGRREMARGNAHPATTPPTSPKLSPGVCANAAPLSPSGASVRSSESSRDGRSAMEIRLEKRMRAEKQAKEIRQHKLTSPTAAEAPSVATERKQPTSVPSRFDETRKVEQPAPHRELKQTSAVAARFDAPPSTRKAPSRPPRPTDAQLPPLPPLSASKQQTETTSIANPPSPPPRGQLPPVPVQKSTPQLQSPPPLPDKSPKRRSSTKKLAEEQTPGRKSNARQAGEELQDTWSQSSENCLSAAVAQLDLNDPERLIAPLRSSTAPNFVNDKKLSPKSRKSSVERTRSTGQGSILITKKPRPRSIASSASNASTTSHSNKKVSKASNTGSGGSAFQPRGAASSATAAIEVALQDIGDVPHEQSGLRTAGRATDGDLRSCRDAVATATTLLSNSREASPVRLPWKRTKRNETMSMLLDKGFCLPPDEMEESKLSFNLRKAMPPSPIRVPTQQWMRDRDSPGTPGSIAVTPTELYEGTVGSRVLSKRMTRGRGAMVNKRSPLGQTSETNAKANAKASANDAFDAEAARLSVTSERLRALVPGENSPLDSGISTPTPMQIQLRNGSVVALTTQEMTAWQRTMYIQGPIGLVKPPVVPRKGSIASLVPFQDAVDNLYQGALNTPRRRSDDATNDEICEFFDEFRFEDIGFGGDLLGPETADEHEEKEVDVDEMELDEAERFATPPMEIQEPTPLQEAKTKAIVDVGPKPVPRSPTRDVTPADSQEMLRAKGIARLSQMSAQSNDSASIRSRRNSTMSSMTVASERSFASSTVPLAEPTMLDIVEELPIYENKPDQGFDWDDDDVVEEVDDNSSWLVPAMLPRNGMGRGLSNRQTRNPVKRVRRFVTTASTLL